MSKRLKHHIDEILLRVRRALHLDPEDTLDSLREKLEQFSEDTVRVIRERIDALWDAHDKDVEHARRFFEQCGNLYKGLMA